MNEENEAQRQYLSSIGVCERCILRHSTIISHKFERNVEKDSQKTHFCCGSCLGILEDSHVQESIDRMTEKINESNYDSSTFCLAISLPQCLVLREKSLMLALKQNKITMPQLSRPGPLSVKNALRFSVISKLEKNINKKHESKSDLLIDLIYGYTKDAEEISKLKPLLSQQKSKKRKYHHKDKQQPDRSIQDIVQAVEKLNDLQIPHYTSCPPQSSTVPCTISVKTLQGSIFIAGRYNKYSRHLSQTPWIIDGARKTETSVQELICGPLQEALKVTETKFLSSGREDVDVKMLGKGRPFAAELIDAKRTTISQEEIIKLQNDINNSTELIAVRDLQIVCRDDLSSLKQGEEEKKKCYRAKIWCDKTISDDCIDKLNSMKDVLVEQKTPIRVLHRRPIMVRPRIIHELAMKRIDDVHYDLSLKTQAGTYIKEFVHSDFGRTVPSLRSLLDASVDIVELDVDAVELDWPPSLATET